MSKNAIMPMDDYKGACDKIREKTESTDLIKSGEMPEKIEEVYEVGKERGSNEYWDLFQNYGNRNYYADAFRQTGYEYIRPKYKVIPTVAGGAVRTFYDSDKLKKIEAQYFNFSQMALGKYSSNGFYNTFTTCGVLEEIEDIGLEGQTYFVSTFYWCGNLKKIARIGVDENTIFDGAFFECQKLEDITFDGVIGTNGLNLSYSPLLTHDSLVNIIECLKDFRVPVDIVSATLDDMNTYSVLTTENRLEVGKKYVWSFYSGEISHQLWQDEIVTAELLTIPTLEGEYVGFYHKYPSVWFNDQCDMYVYVYQDGDSIKEARLFYDNDGDYWNDMIRTDDTISILTLQALETRSITLGTTNLNKLTDAEKAQATEKGWNLT